MDDILFLFTYVFFEFLVWGIFYGTGYFLITIFSFGKLVPEGMEKYRRTRKSKYRRTFPVTYTKDDITYLKSEHVAGVGFLFWAIIAVIFVFYAS